MAYEMKPGQGSLFKNENKTNDRAPTHKGKVMLPNGEVRWLSAWTKKTAAGETWVSLSVGDLVPNAQPQAPVKPLDAHNAAKANGFVSDPDADVPW